MSDKESSEELGDVFKIQAAALWGVFLLASLELIGWSAGLQLQVAALLHCVPMAPSTSICFILLASSLIADPPKLGAKPYMRISAALVSTVVVFCGLALLDYWGETVPYIEDRFFPAPGHLNGVPLARMSPLTAGFFILAGAARLLNMLRSLVSERERWFGNLSGCFASVVAFGGFTILLGYVYGTPFWYGGSTIPVAATTAAAFLLLGVALLGGLKAYDFPNRHFSGPPIHARLIRAFVPLVFFAVLLQGVVSRFAPIFFDVSNALLSAFVAVTITVLAVIAASKAASVVGTAVDQAEENLAKSIKEWELTFNTVSDLILVLDNDQRIVRTNAALAKRLGVSAEEVVGRHCYEVIHGGKGPPPYCPHAQLLKDGQEHCAEFMEPLLGATLDGRVFPLVSEEGHVFGAVHVIRDITERKLAEEELRETTDMLNSVFHSSLDAIVVLDPQGVVSMWNRAAERIFGWSGPEVLGHSSPLVPDDKQQEFRSIRERVFAGECLTGIELSGRRKDGTEIQVSLSAAPLKGAGDTVWGMLCVMTDVTERKKGEAVQRRLATAVEQSIESVMITDSLGHIEYVNPAFERISGYSRKEVIGHRPRFLKSDEHDQTSYRDMNTHVQSGIPWKGRLVSRRKDGKLYFEDVTISPVRNSAGEIVSYVDVGHDVTQHVQLERQLFQAQKMEAIGTLAGGIAHDFNNLLQVILGYSELLLLNTQEGETKHREIVAIRQAASRGAELVHQILTFSRKVETKLRPLDLNHEIRQARTLLTRTIPKMIDIQLDLADDLKTINADSGQLEQVILNLAVNAQHAMPRGGTVTIKTENIVLDDEYTEDHFGVKPGEYALLTVSDSGHGMEKQVVERIFEPFYTTKGPEEGTGLGLAMVFGIVKGHGGHIQCYSKPGEGTTFKIYLPVIEVTRVDRDATAEAPLAFGTETVLLVDDEELIVDLGKRILSRAGYQVLTASRGKEALEIYRTRKDEIALVILDLIMPEMWGKECYEELRKIDPEARIIIASGYSADRLIKESEAAGLAGFLGKPYRINQMLEVVRTALDSE